MLPLFYIEIFALFNIRISSIKNGKNFYLKKKVITKMLKSQQLCVSVFDNTEDTIFACKIYGKGHVEI